MRLPAQLGHRPRSLHENATAISLRQAAHCTWTKYFEGDPENQGDPFIVDSLIMAHHLEDGVRRASFDFVV